MKKAFLACTLVAFTITAGCSVKISSNKADASEPTPELETSSTDQRLHGAVVKINGITYNCIVVDYSMGSDGGVWCDRVSGADAQ